MKTMIAIEGADGSGKTLLVQYAESLCNELGCPFRCIGRENGVAGYLSTLLNEESKQLTPFADALIRVAREHERALEATRCSSGIVILDRFVLSILSRVRQHNLIVPWFMEVLRDITKLAGLHATILVRCPFDVAWERTVSRVASGEKQMSPKERLGADFNRKLVGYIENDFNAGELTGDRWVVNNSGSKEAAQAQLHDLLLPVINRIKRRG